MTLPRRALSFFVCLCLAALVGCQHETFRLVEPSTPGVIAWGQPGNGLQAGLAINAVSGKDDPTVHATIYLRNVGSRAVKLLDPANYYPDPSGLGSAFEIAESGEPLAKLHKDVQPAPPASAFVVVRPGQTLSAKRDIDPAYWALPGSKGQAADPDSPDKKLAAPFTLDVTFVYTGRYEVQRQTEVGLTISSGDVTGLWTGNARSGPVTVHVTK
ncbi:MAG TPA: hypothetical protein VFC78_03930 [Tepidisphaeraceae bacterium]|nr:hypothetical protein [Tepidisphaeraceae bacterium]